MTQQKQQQQSQQQQQQQEQGLGRVLIVDDELGLRMTLAANLELDGFTVLEAASGEEALAVLARERVDVVLTDVKMPGISGIDLFRLIRERHKDVRVVLMTAFALESLVADALAEGVHAVLAKPFDLKRAVDVLVRALKRRVVVLLDSQTGDAASLAAALDSAGIPARAMRDGDELLRVAREQPLDAAVVERSLDLLRRLHDIDPGVIIVMLTRDDVESVTTAAAVAAAAAFGSRGLTLMRKPVDGRQLATALARARVAAPL